MARCLLCKADILDDDVVLISESKRYAVCLLCWRRETEGKPSPVPRDLEREVRDAAGKGEL